MGRSRRLRLSVMRPSRAAQIVLVAAGLGGAACVPRGKYDECVAHATGVQTAADARQHENEGRIAALQQQLTDGETAAQEREAKLSELSTSEHNLQAKLDEATAIHQELRDELMRLGKDVDKILAERGTLSKALDDAKGRLEELRKAQAAAEARIALFRDFEARFKPLIDAKQLRIDAKRGQLVMEIAGDLLFDAARSDLRTAGKGALLEVAHALKGTTASDAARHFLVTANSDAADAKARRAKSVWELTALRSVAVVEYLVSFGVPASALLAGAAASFDPVVAADAPDAHARNRRVEIALVPQTDESLSPAAVRVK